MAALEAQAGHTPFVVLITGSSRGLGLGLVSPDWHAPLTHLHNPEICSDSSPVLCPAPTGQGAAPTKGFWDEPGRFVRLFPAAPTVTLFEQPCADCSQPDVLTSKRSFKFQTSPLRFNSRPSCVSRNFWIRISFPIHVDPLADAQKLCLVATCRNPESARELSALMKQQHSAGELQMMQLDVDDEVS